MFAKGCTGDYKMVSYITCFSTVTEECCYTNNTFVQLCYNRRSNGLNYNSKGLDFLAVSPFDKWIVRECGMFNNLLIFTILQGQKIAIRSRLCS